MTFRAQSSLSALPMQLALVLSSLALLGACNTLAEFGDGEGGDDGTGARSGEGMGGDGAGSGLDVGGEQGGASGCEEGDGGADCPPPPPEPACGDGRINVEGETCDDGNGKSGDGCTGTCALEADFACPTPGKPCVSTVECGDGLITGSETCDDGDDDPDDGCSEQCEVESGWTCPVVGLRCEAAECGDALVVGFEECDFAATTEGCTDCRIDVGYDCNSEGCWQTACYDSLVERGEQCEDSASADEDAPFDGCYACQKEPDCSGGVCVAVCGDGQRYADEACDDGNVRDGDGCSADCEVEEGYECLDRVGAPAEEVRLPVILRDFVGYGNSLRDVATCYDPVLESPTPEKTRPCYHVNFNGLGADGILDVVATELGPNGVPVLDCPGGDCSSNPGVLNGSDGRTGYNIRNFTTQADFDDWFDSSHPEALVVFDELPLPYQAGTGTYLYNATASFYPLDGLGWVALGEEANASASCEHNVSFTTETRFWFEYQGGERFDFSGDDDQWVFVDETLTIDLGGLHGSKSGHFILDADTDGDGPDTADGTALVDTDLLQSTTVPRNGPTGTARGAQTIDLGLEVGGVYEVVMFQAERNECGSNFRVTLKDFNRPKSECTSECGDGIVASDEVCDDGEDGNDGEYGHCNADCKGRGPFCGDGTEAGSDGVEECDDGLNLSQYGTGCAPGCKDPAYCGDGEVQSAFEDCDDGENDGKYGGCAPGCVLGPRCGDGKLQRSEGESCDDGNRKNGDGCNVNCQPDTVVR